MAIDFNFCEFVLAVVQQLLYFTVSGRRFTHFDITGVAVPEELFRMRLRTTWLGCLLI